MCLVRCMCHGVFKHLSFRSPLFPTPRNLPDSIYYSSPLISGIMSGAARW